MLVGSCNSIMNFVGYQYQKERAKDANGIGEEDQVDGDSEDTAPDEY
jgi:hypothetical protein